MLYVLDRALGGVIGNRIDAGILVASAWAGKNVGFRESAEIVLAAMIPIVGAGAWWGGRWVERRRVRMIEARLMEDGKRIDADERRLADLEALTEKIRLVIRLDDGFLRALPNLLPKADRESVLRVLVREWLKDCAAIFAPDVSRAILYRPTSADWLEPWESYGMPESSLADRRFYIGSADDPARLRGVAGEVYVSGEPQVVSMHQDGDLWRADCSDYIDFEKETRFPRYMTFVAVPVDGENDKRMGVLCLDSKTPETFDHQQLMGLLLALGGRIGVAVAIAEVLQELDPE